MRYIIALALILIGLAGTEARASSRLLLLLRAPASAPASSDGSALLLEDGTSYLLLEDGSKLLLE